MGIIEEILFWIHFEPTEFVLTIIISLMSWSIVDLIIYEKIEEKKNKKEKDIM